MGEKKELWENVHQASKIFILPNFFTAGNLFFGFLSIVMCVQARFNAAAGESAAMKTIASFLLPNAKNIDQSTAYYLFAMICILIAFFCDAFDGRVARASGKTSLFGKEFDSLADSVSFGLAPALLMFFLILQPAENMSESWRSFLKNTGWLIGFIFLLCAAVRLARFNVLTNPYITGNEKYSSGDFSGLPAPAAAGAVTSIALTMLSFDLKNYMYALIPLMLLIAFFMVSNIPYPSFKHINWTTSTRFRTFVALVLCVLLIVLMREYSFAIMFLSYVFYSPLKYLPRGLKILKYKAKKISKKNSARQENS